MPAPTTQTSALVFLSNVDDRMIEAVATQTEGVLRRLDRRFRTVLFLEGRLDVFFVMIGNRLRQSANQGASSENVGTPVMCAHLAAGAASKFGQTAKARSGYMCSHSLTGCGKTRFEADGVPRNSLVSTAHPDKKEACVEKTRSSGMFSAT